LHPHCRFIALTRFYFAGISLCFGSPVDRELLDLVRIEVENLQESVKWFNEDSKKKKVQKYCKVSN
jgi:hypothetical protein